MGKQFYALMAIIRSSDVDRSILLHISSEVDYVKVLVENYSGKPVDASFSTSKPDKSNHGFGIAQMRSIALKYNGDVQPKYDIQTGKFSLNVLLEQQQN